MGHGPYWHIQPPLNADALYQETAWDPFYKQTPCLKDEYLQIWKNKKNCEDMLPSEVVPPHPKPVIYPIIPPNIILEVNASSCIEGQILETVKDSKLNEHFIAYI